MRTSNAPLKDLERQRKTEKTVKTQKHRDRELPPPDLTFYRHLHKKAIFQLHFSLPLLTFLFPLLCLFTGCQESSSSISPNSLLSNKPKPQTKTEAIQTKSPQPHQQPLPTISESTTLPVTYTGSAMTVPFRILIGDAFNEEQKKQIEAVITTTFDEVDKVYNKWNPQSELSQMNDLPANTSFILSPQMNQFLNRIDPLVTLSQGRFDPTVEPIQKLWKAKMEEGTCPSPEEIAALKPSIGWKTISFTNGIFIKQDGRTRIDLGGVAKGFCVDLLIERLEKEGLPNLYVDWGGEIRTTGLHPEKRPWRIAIGQLSKEGTMRPLTQLELINSAIATSGDSFQFWDVKTAAGEPKRYCHVFDPQTLSPLEVKAGSVATASLIASDCLTADALAKVLMIFPSTEEAQKWVKEVQLSYPNVRCWIQHR